jgi:glycosyltransferase involved in cell wall biosynthesis
MPIAPDNELPVPLFAYGPGGALGDPVQLSEYRDHPCVVLVGPAGSGKTTLLRSEYRRARTENRGARFISLQTTRHKGQFMEEILPLANEVPQSDSKSWYVFIDGLDEVADGPLAALHWLEQSLRTLVGLGFEREHLKVRISTRPAAFSRASVNEVIGGFFGIEEVAAVQIGRLTPDLIQRHIQTSSEGTREFVRKARERGILEFVETPVTLQFLLKQYSATGKLPDDPAQLLRGFVAVSIERTLAEEKSHSAMSWADASSKAATLAAAMALSGKASLRMGSRSLDAAGADTMVASELGPYFDEKLIALLLEAGLLTGEMGGSVSWAHKTIQEYLAAESLASSVESQNALELLQTTVSGKRGFRPQLREVASWLATIDATFRDTLILADPTVLFGSELALKDNHSRSALTKSLLDLVSEHGVRLISWKERDKYKKLKHPGLAADLATRLADVNALDVVKLTAIEIGTACLEYDLGDVLSATAHDAQASPRVRTAAVEALAVLGSDHQIQQLRKLIALPVDEDPEDEIRGAALQALWPTLLSASELFSVLWPARRRNLIGNYSSFLYNLQIPRLDQLEAVAACRWIETVSQSEYRDVGIGRIVPSVIQRVWEACDSSEVVSAFAGVLLSGMRHELFDWSAKELEVFTLAYTSAPSARRRDLLYALHSRLSNSPESTFTTVMYAFPWRLLDAQDLSWLLADLMAGVHREVLLRFVVYFSVIEGPEKAAHVWKASESDEELHGALSEATAAAKDAELARASREQSMRLRLASKQSNEQPLEEVVGALLRQLDDGIPAAWWQLNKVLLTDDNGSTHDFSARVDLGSRWPQLTPNTQSEIVGAAKRHLETFSLEFGWLKKNIHHRPAAAVYRAIRLVSVFDPSFLENADHDAWAKWALPIVAFSSNDSGSERTEQARLFSRLYERSLESAIGALRVYIDAWEADGLLHLADLVSACTSSEVLEVLWSVWISAPVERRYANLARLFAHTDYQPFDRLFYSTLREPFRSEADRQWRRQIASAYISGRPQSVSAWLMRVLADSIPIGKVVVDALASEDRQVVEASLNSLSSSDIATLYEFADQHFQAPDSTDEVQLAGGNYDVEQLRQILLTHLRDRANDEAVMGLKSISQRRPEMKWLSWLIRDAETKALAASTVWPAPRAIFSQLSAPAPSLKADSSPTSIPVNNTSSEDVPIPIAAVEAEVSTASQRSLSFLFFADEWLSGKGGISTINRDLCCSLAALGHKVQCYIPGASDRDIALGQLKNVKIVRAVGLLGLSPSEMLAFGPSVEEIGDLDFVVGHEHVTGPPGLAWASKRAKAKYLHVVHTMPDAIGSARMLPDSPEELLRGDAKRMLQKALCKASALVVCVGPMLRNYMQTILSSEEVETVELIPGLSVDLQSHTTKLDRLLERNCVFVGRGDDVRVKGLDLVAALIRSDHLLQAADGEANVILRGMTQPSMLELFNGSVPGRTRARGFSSDQEEIWDELKSASVVLMPSRAEAFGLVALEAISAGVPILISEGSGIALLLKRLAKDRKLSPELVTACCLPITDQPDVDVSVWGKRIRGVLEDRKPAFVTAGKLRAELSGELTWARAADSLVQVLRGHL